MATRKINRKKNLTQRKKYKKRGNKLLNTQKRIRKQSKINRQLMRKQTCKINRCKKCKGVKNLKMSKKKLDKLRNAGVWFSDAADYLRKNALACCGDNSDAVFEGTTDSKGELIPYQRSAAASASRAAPSSPSPSPEAVAQYEVDRAERRRVLTALVDAAGEEEAKWEENSRRGAAATKINAWFRGHAWPLWLAAVKKQKARLAAEMREQNALRASEGHVDL